MGDAHAAPLDLRAAERDAACLALYERGPCGHHTLAPDGTILTMNDTELGWLGYARAELVGKRRLEDLMTPADREAALRLHAALATRAGTLALESHLLRRDGTALPVALHVSARRDAGGAIAEIHGVVLDISAQKQSEELLHKSRDALSLANAALERAGRSRDEFLAAVTHELRTPLNAVLGLCEALQEGAYGAVAERQLDALRHIELSGRHLAALIGEILDLSKIEAGRIELEVSSVAVDRVCHQSLRAIEPLAREKGQRVSLRLDGAPERVPADERRLAQILVNLLENAVKFTPKGGAVALAVERDPEREAVRFTVSDTGAGIARDEVGRAFQAFVQLDGSLARRHAGTGLGLALVRKLVELHEGGVSVESHPGRGSRVSVLLPAGPTESSGVLGRRAALRALVVEDTAPAAAQIERFLAEGGVDTTLHGDDEGVVERVAEERPEVVLLDVVQPAEGGFDTLRELKADPRTARIPVIVVSAGARREEARALGADGFLVKPVSRAQLQAAVARVTIAAAPVRPVLIVEPRRASQLPTVARVLLAEDDETSVAAVIAHLEGLGYQMIVARNGMEAVEIAREVRPDLILADVHMPVLDGLRALEAIRADARPELREVPIVVLPSLEVQGDRERCLAAGATRYLPKPVSLPRLAAVVEELLAPRRLRGSR